MSTVGSRGTHPIDTDVAKRVIAEIECELKERIMPLVAQWPEAEINSLLRRMAELKYRYDGADWLRRSRGPDR